MSNLVHLPNSRREKEEAAQWLARLDRGLTRTEFDSLSGWLRDKRRREALYRLAHDWDNMAVLEELAELFPLPAAESSPPSMLLRFAAALVVTVAGAALWWHSRTPSHPVPTPVLAAAPAAPPPSAQGSYTVTYATAVGERRLVELPDHSRVRLNTNTRLQVEYTANARLLTMQRGEALFEVAKDTERVFTVRVAGYDFKAVGTAFDIRADIPGGLRLTVTEGRVRVNRAPPDQSGDAVRGALPSKFEVSTDAVVDVNETLSIDHTSARIDLLTNEQVKATTLWQHGTLAFKSRPLAEVVAEVNRYSTVPFVIADPAIRSVPVSGYFDAGDIDNLAKALEQNLGIEISRRDGSYWLSASPSATKN